MIWSDTKKGIAVSLGIHVVFACLIGVAGWQAYQKKLQDPKIYSVAILPGNPGKKGNGLLAKKITAPAPVQPQTAQPQEVPVPRPVDPETIPEPVDKPLEPEPQPAVQAPASTANVAPSQATGGAVNGSEQGVEGGTGTGTGDGEGVGDGPGGGGGPSFDTEAIQPDVSPEELGHENPAYPDPMRNRGIQGRVTIQMVVGKDGSVESASVIGSSGYGLLDRAALDSAYTYSFSPAYKEGIPVRCYATKTVVFRL